MVTITNEDNMDLMAHYLNKYFDLAFIYPPYGISAGGLSRIFLSIKYMRSFSEGRDEK